jgi:hypothetical protein
MANFSGVAAGGFAQGFGQGAQIAQSATEAKAAKEMRVKQEALQDFQNFRMIIGEADPVLRDATLDQYLRAKNIDTKDPGIKSLKTILAKGDEQTLAALRDAGLQGALKGLPLGTQLELMKKNPLGLLEHKRKMDEQATIQQVLFGGATPGPVAPGATPVAEPGAGMVAQAPGAAPVPMAAPGAAPAAPTAPGDPIEAKIQNLRTRAAVAASTKNTAAVTFLNQQIATLEGFQKEQRTEQKDIAKEQRDLTNLGKKERIKADVEAETPKEAERISAGFADRMQQNESIIAQLGDKFSSPSVMERAAGAVPLAGKELANISRPEERQKYHQAQEDWVRAKLRKESGAVIADEEMDREIRTYFPQIGDKPEVIAQKNRARALATQGMIRNAGRGYQRIQTQGTPTTRKPENDPLGLFSK